MNTNFKEMKSSQIKKYITDMLKEENSNFDYYKIIDTLKNDERKTVQKLCNSVYKFLEYREKEISRVKQMYDFDKKFITDLYIAGVDEVGRGPLAGPIVAAAVILKLDYKESNELILKINDSKKLSQKTREELDYIIKDRAVSYCITEISSMEIDEKGIAWCNNEVLKRAANGLNIKPSLVLSDGYAIKNCNIENKFIIKGDTQSASIACASIIAKVYRDKLMKDYSEIYPQYGFEKNVGYGTKDHIEAIKKYGYTDIHRKSFLKNIINMFDI